MTLYQTKNFGETARRVNALVLLRFFWYLALYVYEVVKRRYIFRVWQKARKISRRKCKKQTSVIAEKSAARVFGKEVARDTWCNGGGEEVDVCVEASPREIKVAK